MENRTITTLGKANKAFLRNEFGVKTINEAKKNFGVDTAEEAYEIMMETHNQIVAEEKKNKEKELKAKKQEEKKKREEARKVKRNVEVFDYTKIPTTQISQKLYDVLEKYKNKNIVVDVYSGEDRELSYTYDLRVPSFSDIWAKSIVFDLFYPVAYYNAFNKTGPAILYIYEGEEMNKKDLKRIVQVFRDAENGKCVFNPVRDWATEKIKTAQTKQTKCTYRKVLNTIDELETLHPDGVNENNISDVANALQIDISIEVPFSNQTFITAKSTKKALKHFRYKNTRLNHVEPSKYTIDDKPEIVSRNELLQIKKNLDEKKTHYHFTKDKNNISSISTLEKCFSIGNEKQEAFNKFEIETGLIHCKIDDIADKDLSLFVRCGTHYNGTVDFKNVNKRDAKKAFLIDMRKAYANFNLCKFYEGFLGKITDFRKTDKIEGVGLYYIYDLNIPNGKLKLYNDKLNIYKSNNIYSSAELKFLQSKQATFKIKFGCWGVKEMHFSFNDEMMNEKDENGNSFYALWAGKSDSHNLNKNIWLNGDAEYADLINKHLCETGNTNTKILKFENGELCLQFPKANNFHLGHITAFITAYQRLNVLEQLEEININSIIRVCVDGIYLQSKPNFVLKNCFRAKNDDSDKTFNNVAGLTYISNVLNDNELSFIYENHNGVLDLTDKTQTVIWNVGNKRVHNCKELHIGAGGNGKTHKNLIDTGLIRVLYIAPSWKLARNKQEEYKCSSTVWARVITDDPEKINYVKRFYNVLLFDECSMMTEQEKQKIFTLYENVKIIFCGDLGNQLSSWNGEEMNTSGFNAVINNNINYRCKDPRLLELLNTLRVMIKNKINTYEMNKYVLEFFKNKTITREMLKKMYKIEDMILVGTRVERDESKNWFPELKKYYCLETNRKYCNGEIVLNNEPECKNELRHAYTVHSIQGETAHNNLFIESSKMFDCRMFYTAISRAKTLDQIFIIV